MENRVVLNLLPLLATGGEGWAPLIRLGLLLLVPPLAAIGGVVAWWAGRSKWALAVTQVGGSISGYLVWITLSLPVATPAWPLCRALALAAAVLDSASLALTMTRHRSAAFVLSLGSTLSLSLIWLAIYQP